jgi:hypothetical protein
MFPSDFAGFFFSLICGLFVVVGSSSTTTLPTFLSIYHSFCRSVFSTELAWFSFVAGNKVCCEFLWCVI